MVLYGFLDAISDLIGLASTAAVVVSLVTGLQPEFKRVRDSCRAGKQPEGRVQLLWSAFLILIVWGAANALYFRNLFSLWNIMGRWLKSQPVNRPVYALLHLYLYFLLLCGIYAGTVTSVKISQNGQVLSDLVMIARFRTNEYHLVEDTEAQDGSSASGRIGPESEIADVVDLRSTTSPPHDEGLRSNGQGFRENVAPATARTKQSEYPAQEPTWSASDHPVGQFTTRAVAPPLWLVDANTL